MPSSRRAVPSAALALGAATGLTGLTATPARAAYTFTTLDDPASPYFTSVTAINGLGQVVGYYGDIANTSVHGFLYDPATAAFTTITGPNAARYTYLTGINDADQVVGYSSTNGFLYSAGGFTTITDPSGVYTTPVGLNNAGQIVGYYDTTNGQTSGSRIGFLDTGGKFISILGPGPSTFTQAAGINDAGQVVGTYTDPVTGRGRGFLYTNGALTTINAPGAVFGTSIFGINNAGLMVGSYNDASNAIHGFLDSGGVFTTLDYPGATGTNIEGINSAGELAGTYTIGTHLYGFLATPNAAVPEPAPAALLGLGLLPIVLIVRRRRTAA